MKSKSKGKGRKAAIWIISILVILGIGTAVTFISVNSANAEWCDRVLAMSADYMEPHRGGLDFNTASESQIKDELPKLEDAYRACEIREGDFVRYEGNLQRAGWDLALAYLKLHRKSDAERIIKVLASVYRGSAFGDHCVSILNEAG